MVGDPKKFKNVLIPPLLSLFSDIDCSENNWKLLARASECVPLRLSVSYSTSPRKLREAEGKLRNKVFVDLLPWNSSFITKYVSCWRSGFIVIKFHFRLFKLAECGKAGWWVDCSIIQSNVGIIVFTECWTINLQPSVVFGKENILTQFLCKTENILSLISFC